MAGQKCTSFFRCQCRKLHEGIICGKNVDLTNPMVIFTSYAEMALSLKVFIANLWTAINLKKMNPLKKFCYSWLAIDQLFQFISSYSRRQNNVWVTYLSHVIAIKINVPLWVAESRKYVGSAHDFQVIEILNVNKLQRYKPHRSTTESQIANAEK